MHLYLIAIVLSAATMASARVLPSGRSSDNKTQSVEITNISNSNVTVVKNTTAARLSHKKSIGVDYEAVNSTQLAIGGLKASDCAKNTTASATDTCCSLAAANSLSLSQFLLYNPLLDCDNLNSTTTVCIKFSVATRVAARLGLSA